MDAFILSPTGIYTLQGRYRRRAGKIWIGKGVARKTALWVTFAIDEKSPLGTFPLYQLHWTGEHGNPLQYSGLEHPTDRRAWRASVHGLAKSRTRLSKTGNPCPCSLSLHVFFFFNLFQRGIVSFYYLKIHLLNTFAESSLLRTNFFFFS